MQPFTEPHHLGPASCPPGVLPDGALTPITTGKERFELRPLKAAILSLEWEISAAVVQRYDAELQRLEALWARENIRLACLRILRALGKYITLHLAATPQEAISLVASVYDGLERMVSTPGMRDAEKVGIVQGELKKYNELKKILTTPQKPSPPRPAQPPAAPAAKVVPLAGASPWRQSVIEDLFRQPGSTPEDERIAAQHLSVFTPPPAVRQAMTQTEEKTASEAVAPVPPAHPITAEDIADKLNSFFDDDRENPIDGEGVVPLSPTSTAKVPPAAQTVAAGETTDLLSSLFRERPSTPADTLLADMHLRVFGGKTPENTTRENKVPQETRGTAPLLDETAIRHKLDSFFDEDGTEGTGSSTTGLVRLHPENAGPEAPPPPPLRAESDGRAVPAEESRRSLPEGGEKDPPMPRARFERLQMLCASAPLPELARETLALVADARPHRLLAHLAAHLEQAAATARIAPLLSPALQDDARDIIEKLLRQIVPALTRQGDIPGAMDVRSLARAMARHAALVDDLLSRRGSNENESTPPAPPEKSPTTGQGGFMDLTSL